MMKKPISLCVCLLLGASAQAQVNPGQGERASWLKGSWGALWLPENTYNGVIEGVSIDTFVAQIAHLRTIDYVQIALASPNIFSPAHTAQHPILESLWRGDTATNGSPLNLIVPRASAPDPFLSWLKALKAAGLKVEVYVNSYNMLDRIPESIPAGYPDVSARWKAHCDTDPTFQAFINSKSYHTEGSDPRRAYMFCYAEFILREYAIRYGDLIDAWCFDSADNIMEACGDSADSGILAEQRIYEAFANACHAGNPNAAISFNNSVGVDGAPFATATLFDDYTFGHPFGGAGNMVVPEILYTRNFAICQFMRDTGGLPFANDNRTWNDKVVGHFFPKQSTTSWNGGAVPCLTDAQFVEWNSVGLINGGAITWGTPLVRGNLLNSPVLTLQPYALAQLEMVDAHLSQFQFPDRPNWRRADTPLPDAASEATYSHTLTDGIDFWNPSGGRVSSLSLVGQPSWLTVAESSPGSGVWTLGGVPTEAETTTYTFNLRATVGAAESSRTVRLKVNKSPVMSTTNRTIIGGAAWVDSGIELTYGNNGTSSSNRAISYSSESFQSSGGFKLKATYTTGSIGNTGDHNFSFGLVRTDTDVSNYTGLNPFGSNTNVHGLGVNLTTDLGASLRGLIFTNGSTVSALDVSGTNVQFATGVSTPVVIEMGPNGAWTYSINGIVEASGTIPEGFDLSKSYRVVVYGQDDNGGGKSIQSLALELKPPQVAGLVADWSMDDSSGALVADRSGNGFHGSLVDGTALAGVSAGAVGCNGTSSRISLPGGAFASIGNEVTVSMWVNGGASQPAAQTVFHAIDSSGYRVLNIHLPWSNSKVIWDAGNSGGTTYDRISANASSADFKGRWNHWVFTKNALRGEMKIYLNGSLWHSSLLQDGTDSKVRTMGGIVSGFIASSAVGAYYHGMIDEVKLCNTALNATEVSELYRSYKGFKTWLSRYRQLANIGPSSDSDQDGTALVFEYLLNGNPLVADPAIRPTMESSGEGFIFKFTRLAESADDTEQWFQYSTDMVDWNDLRLTGNAAPGVSVGDQIDGSEEVTITIDDNLSNEGRLFGRLKAIAE